MNPAKRLFSAFFVFGVKTASLMMYRTEAQWFTPKENIQWEKLRLIVALNHTSLFEPLFISAIPNYRLWRAIRRVVVPVADVTMNRPLVGRLFKYLVPNAIPITRKRDDSWEDFISRARGDSIMFIFPEGRMKRAERRSCLAERSREMLQDWAQQGAIPNEPPLDEGLPAADLTAG